MTTFTKSPHFTDTGSEGRRIDLLVIHSMEMEEKGSTAEDCARWFQNPAAQVSAHYCIDNNSIVQCVTEMDVAWAAPGANHDGIQLEHAGRARQTRAEWLDPYGKLMLDRSAKLAADICKRHKIPVTFLSASGLVAQRRGITTHKNVSDAFKRGSHWDPGSGFPMDWYLALVKKYMGANPPVSPGVKSKPRQLSMGNTGWEVKQLQRLLNFANELPKHTWPKLTVDGNFGATTKQALIAFQKMHGLNAIGVCGPYSWQALWEHRYQPNGGH